MALEACREEIRPGIEPWGNPRLTLYHVESTHMYVTEYEDAPLRRWGMTTKYMGM
jgi:hypothetical protein